MAGASSAPMHLAGLTLLSGGKRRTLLANLTDRPVEARVSGAPGAGRLRTLDLSSVERASRAPAEYRSQPGEPLATKAFEARLELGAYATTCIDWE